MTSNALTRFPHTLQIQEKVIFKIFQQDGVSIAYKRRASRYIVFLEVLKPGIEYVFSLNPQVTDKMTEVRFTII